MDKKYILLFVLIVIFFLLIFYIQKNIIKESFANSDIYVDNYEEEIAKIIAEQNKKQSKCNNLFKDNSFCQWDENLNKCSCKYQKDELKYAFPAEPDCCDRQCSFLPKEKCLLLSPNLKQPKYYCNIGGKCYERTATIKNNQISANNCGLDSLNNQLLLPYTSLEECEGRINVCDKYNDPKYSLSEKKSLCMSDNRCGFCTNNTNDGKCIEGTASGPLDLQKYYYCDPSRTEGTYEYKYGDQAQALNISEINAIPYESNPNYLI